MITVKVQSKELSASLRKVPIEMREFVSKGLRKKAKEYKGFAKKVAPSSSGELSRAIYSKVRKDPVTMEIGVHPALTGPTGFPYPAFTAGRITIRTRNPQNRYFRAGQTIRYGLAAVSPSGAPIRWSASARWWDAVEDKVRRGTPQVVNKAIKDYLKEKNK